ncbi:MAG: ATP-binding protein [Acidimicrobiaceae bacterium]|nr:ATP-binding protein [Acidimicrobiaceae bacterium]
MGHNGRCDLPTRRLLEGRFVWLALRSLRHGVDVVLDFGVWAKVERSALRVLAVEAGASCDLVCLEIDEVEQLRRRDDRASSEPDSTVYITNDELADYRRRIEPRDDVELLGGEVDPPPGGHDSWRAWASQ